MLYVYRSRPSNGAVLLADVLGGKKIRRIENATRLAASGRHKVIAWGEACPGALNGAPFLSKFDQAIKLKEAGVPTIDVSRSRPNATTADPAPDALRNLRSRMGEFNLLMDHTNLRTEAGLSHTNALHDALAAYRAALAERPQSVEWLARSSNHVGGNDLLRGITGSPSFYSKKLSLVSEFRIHSFQGKSIRAGIKAPRIDADKPASIHPWIRSWDGGWRILYDGVSSKKAHRELAHAAVSALGLDFGAVDIGVDAAGALIVLEVNRAPGLDGRTIDCYAEAIQRWLDGPEEDSENELED